MSFFQKFAAAVSYGGEAGDIRIHTDFEGAGDPISWSAAGGLTFDHTDTPLAGSQSMYGSTSTHVGTATFTVIEGTTHLYMLYACPLTISQQGLFELYGGGVRLLRGRVLTNGTVRFYNGDLATNFTSGTALVPTANTLAHLWIDYTPGTGSNGVMDAYTSTDGTKPGSPTYSRTDLTATANCDELRCPTLVNSGYSKWDNVIVSAAVIGSNPF